MPEGKTIDQIKIGDSAQISNTITETVISDFAKATGDFNPIRIRPDLCGKNILERKDRPRCPLGRVSSPGALWGVASPDLAVSSLSQDVKFLAPVRIGDVITAKAEVIELIPGKNRVKFKTTCTNQKGEVVVDGTAWSLCPQKR